MRKRGLSYADAIKILDHGTAMLGAIEDILGGLVLGGAAATGSVGFLDLLGAREELGKHARRLLARFGECSRARSWRSRADLLVAAHCVIVLSAFFEALGDTKSGIAVTEELRRLPFDTDDQISLAAGSAEPLGRDLVNRLLNLELPRPSVGVAHEDTIEALRSYYKTLSGSLLDFLKGLVIWDRLTETDKERLYRALINDVPAHAIDRYEDAFLRLCTDHPGFFVWGLMLDNAATREQLRELFETNVRQELRALHRSVADLRTGMAGLRAFADPMPATAPERGRPDWLERISRAWRKGLQQPIAEAASGTMLAGLRLPTIEEGYVNPTCRVGPRDTYDRLADDRWWLQQPQHELQWFLYAYLRSPEAIEAPLVLLGQAGSGKSLLTKVLAATLPDAGFLPVRVELRRVRADAPPQEQIEQALQDATGVRITWPELVERFPDVLPVVLFDGFDEVLQATELDRANYLEQLQQFQEREEAQGRPVSIVLTSRTVVANRVRYPESTVAVRLDPFNLDQIAQWLTVWNRTNKPYFERTGRRPLSPKSVSDHLELAREPLLLLMLALYDAESNALQHPSTAIGQRELYEGLLDQFIRREVVKQGERLSDEQLDEEAAGEQRRLSIVALAMFNRGRQLVRDAELNADFAALGIDERAAPITSSSARLTPGELIVGRFFFIHESQARIGAEEAVRAYEFLHATFGEYLVARLIDAALIGLDMSVSTRATAWEGMARLPPSDQDLRTFLSWAPLTDRAQVVRFLRDLVTTRGDDIRQRLRTRLIELFRHVHDPPRSREYGGYAPRRLPPLEQAAVYGANLLVLLCAVGGAVNATELFGQDAESPARAWRQRALLWKALLPPSSWDGFVDAFTVQRCYDAASRRDLLIQFKENDGTHPEAVDGLRWFLDGTDDDPAHPGRWMTAGTVTDLIRHDKFVAEPAVAAVLHAVRPLLNEMAESFVHFAQPPVGEISSGANILAWLRLSSTRRSAAELEASYRQAFAVYADIQSAGERERYLYVVLLQFRLDIAGMSPSTSMSVVSKVMDLVGSLDVSTRTLGVLSDCVLGLLDQQTDPLEPLAWLQAVVSDLLRLCTGLEREREMLRLFLRAVERGIPPHLVHDAWVDAAAVFGGLDLDRLAETEPILVAELLHVLRNRDLKGTVPQLGLDIASLPHAALRRLTEADIRDFATALADEPGATGQVGQLWAAWHAARAPIETARRQHESPAEGAPTVESPPPPAAL